MPTLKTSLTLPSEPDKVDAWMDALDYPLKPVAQALRTLILRASRPPIAMESWGSSGERADG